MSVNLFRRLRCFYSFSQYRSCTSQRICGFRQLQDVPQLNSNPALFLEQKRFKYKKTSKSLVEEESDSEESDEEDEFGAQGVIITGNMLSLRVDSVLKAGLKLARNKVEVLFYEGRIRVNGKKIPKKGMKVNVKDEIDLIKGVNNINPALLMISRIVVKKVTDDEDKLIVTMKRYKHLDIENYPDEHQWLG